VKNPVGRKALVYPSVVRSIVLKQISKEWDGRTYTRFILLRIGTLVRDSFEHGKEPSSCIKLREFLDWIRKYYLPRTTLLSEVSYLVLPCTNKLVKFDLSSELTYSRS